MVRVYSSRDKLSSDGILIDNEAFFRNWTVGGTFGCIQKDIITKIDHAIIIDEKARKIQTPYGITSLQDLSTGCKTVLNYIFIRENKEQFQDIVAINAIECGKNALDVLFDVMELKKDSEFIVLLEHRDNVALCMERDYFIDDERHVTNLFGL